MDVQLVKIQKDKKCYNNTKNIKFYKYFKTKMNTLFIICPQLKYIYSRYHLCE